MKNKLTELYLIWSNEVVICDDGFMHDEIEKYHHVFSTKELAKEFLETYKISYKSEDEHIEWGISRERLINPTTSKKVFLVVAPYHLSYMREFEWFNTRHQAEKYVEENLMTDGKLNDTYEDYYIQEFIIDKF